MARARQSDADVPDIPDRPEAAHGTAEDTDISAAQAATVAVDLIERLTRRQPMGVTSVQPTDDGWLAEVEVVEESRVPSTANILGLYEIDMDMRGELLAYRRTRRYGRGRTE